jgi:hypothetical protein
MANETNSDSWSLGTKADENDVWTVEKSASEWMEELTDYDYVVILQATEVFAEEFAGVFENATDVASSSVFAVKKAGSRVSLLRVP